MKSLSYLLFTSLSLALILAAPLGPCSDGRATYTETYPASGGQCRLPIPAPTGTGPNVVYRSSINQALYDQGSACGSCFEVTGSLGVITVVIIDQCQANVPACAGDRANFVIEKAGYNQIVNTTSSFTSDIIYDAGFRLVTCPYADGTSVNAFVPSGTQPSYFQVSFFYSRYPISAVAIKTTQMKQFEPLTRVSSSALWQWNQQSGGSLLQFPVQFSIVSNETNQVLFYTVQNPWSYTSDNTIAFTGAQFTDVVNSNSTCPQAVPPSLIYNNGVVGYGWNAQKASYGTEYVNLTYPGSKFEGVTYAVQAGMYKFTGFQVSRTGGFNALYYQNLTFSVYSDRDTAVNLLVYLTANSGSLSSAGQTVSITSTPQTFTLNVSTLADGNDVITAVAFQINDNIENIIQVFFSNLTWGLNAVNPQTEIPPVADTGKPVLNTTSTSGSTGGTTPPIVIYTTSGFSFSDSEAPSVSTSATTGSNTNSPTSGTPSTSSPSTSSPSTSSSRTTAGSSSSAISMFIPSVVVVFVALLSLF